MLASSCRLRGHALDWTRVWLSDGIEPEARRRVAETASRPWRCSGSERGSGGGISKETPRGRQPADRTARSASQSQTKVSRRRRPIIALSYTQHQRERERERDVLVVTVRFFCSLIRASLIYWLYNERLNRLSFGFLLPPWIDSSSPFPSSITRTVRDFLCHHHRRHWIPIHTFIVTCHALMSSNHHRSMLSSSWSRPIVSVIVNVDEAIVDLNHVTWLHYL